MILNVLPTRNLKGQIELPASKSYSIRAFIIAACGGESTIIHPSNCKDAIVASSIARALGVKLTKNTQKVWQVSPKKSRTISRVINVQESGTGLRFLLPLACLQNKDLRITGVGSLKGRPNSFLTGTLRQMGADIHGIGPQESIPLTVKPGLLSGGKYSIDGSLSSQFISALLITCPMLAQDTHLHIKGKKLVSADYIQMTEQVLAKAGIVINHTGPRAYHIPGNQRYKGLRRFHVPADYGLAAFLLAASAILPSDVVLSGYMKDDLVQADAYIIPLLKEMGVSFKLTPQSIRLKGPFSLKGGTFSLQNAPDLVPIMAILGLMAKGKTRLKHIKHARVKESDRISDLRSELLKVGACVEEKEDELTIYPLNSYKENVFINPHNDHRLAMAFSVFGLRYGIRIKDIECTHKSYPDFVKDLKSLKARAILKRK